MLALVLSGNGWESSYRFLQFLWGFCDFFSGSLISILCPFHLFNLPLYRRMKCLHKYGTRSSHDGPNKTRSNTLKTFQLCNILTFLEFARFWQVQTGLHELYGPVNGSSYAWPKVFLFYLFIFNLFE